LELQAPAFRRGVLTYEEAGAGTRPATDQGGAIVNWTSGGYLAELPKPWKRMFPGRSKRRVSVSIYKYYGLGQHYWVSLHEEGNPIWDRANKCWRSAWDDKSDDTKGRLFSRRCLSLVSARSYVEKIQKKFFPNKTHKLDVNAVNLSEPDEKVWLGIYKEGD